LLLRNRLISVFFCWLVFSPQCFAYRTTGHIGISEAEAMQAADILGVSTQFNHLLLLEQVSGSPDGQSEEAVVLKSLILRKILRAVLEVRQACNKIDLELAYTYDVMQKEQRHQRFMFELFNLANFGQLSTFYTLEPFVRLQDHFATSATFTTVSGSLSTTISTLSRLYGHMAKASHVAPPKILSNLIDGKPVDTYGMPPLVTKFMDSKSLDSNQSRREELFAIWRKRYHVEPTKPETLCGLASRKNASLGLLNTRILLLWSLHTFAQDFDHELLALLKMVRVAGMKNPDSINDGAATAAYGAGLNEIMRLLKIQ
jgi:hypothetical protein